ncbi:replication restart helicase PriA [Aquisphaera insulae]|uniref:replication restart helicase PriA n=1 Tax=Aquisphaera insulae TaxID=2712864 RepID=UPI0013EE17C0|nr:primosomal protein N' [Aquisphaera insulae]
MFEGEGQAGESSPEESPEPWFGADRVAPRAGGGLFAGIVVNRPIDQVLTYHCGLRLAASIRPGQRVRVPLGRGNRPAVGYCVSVEQSPPDGLDPARLKEVIEVLDPAPLIDAGMLELTRWMADYYVCSWGQALDSAVPAGVRNQAGTRVGTFLLVPEETREALRDQTLKPRLSPKQAAALETLCRATGPLTIADVCRRARCTTAPILALRRLGLIHSVKRRVGLSEATEPDDVEGEGEPDLRVTNGPPVLPDSHPRGGSGPTLTPEQDAVMAALRPALAGDGFAPFLIHGVTGSGKTEVYLSAIEQAVARGREAIVLVPEISLTPQTIRRFRRRFDRVAVLHSHLSDVERHRHWQSIAEGEVQVVVGARSAIFAPTRRLGLIVIDEEHESTFKQETVPRYHARDVAVKRAQLERVPVLMGSATPALESWRNADRGRYVRLSMPSRVEGRPMPDVDIIDLRREKKFTGGLSESLRTAVHRALEDGGQVILLLNRRGFHTFVICPHCGGVVKCHACDVAMTHHKGRRLLLCHTCDAERPCPPACPSCGAQGLHYGGIGTERLEREVIEAFPGRVVRRMDSDTMRRPGSHEEVLAAFKAGEVHILLGTQMIAKGLDFPNVTLVGVVNADTALHLPDFRAAERTFQLVAQVAGRTGRGEKPGRVLVQTYTPEHAAIAHAVNHDYEGFVAVELPERLTYERPPFWRIARVIARGPEEAVVEEYMKRLGSALREAAEPSVRFLGPAPAPILKIRNLYRFHLHLRCLTARPLQTLLHAVPARVPPPGGVELAIDVDPTSTL